MQPLAAGRVRGGTGGQLERVTVLLRFLANVNSRSHSLYAGARPSVCRLSSVTLLHPTQAVVIFGNISTTFGTIAIR